MTSQTPKTAWWRDAVIYQIYPRSWADHDGDGIGDLPGIISRLDHLRDLGVDAVWLSPFYTSPQNDAGYDVANYRDVDPLFGQLSDADALIAKAHEFGIRVVVDLVPNHSSSEHAWFQAALAAAPGSPERDRYIFRDGAGADGGEPPNNWGSVFGGSAWERVIEADGRPGQWYLHLFDRTQPDFNWLNPDVGDEMESVIRFWLDRGVDGFRVDVAHALIKAEGLVDVDLSLDMTTDRTADFPMWDQEEVHQIYRRWRRVAEEYAVAGEDRDRILCGEAWVTPADRLARYIRPDEMHQTFNFDFLMTPWLADDLRATITESLDAAEAVGAPQTWVLSNHDVVRHASRLGFDQLPGKTRVPGIGADDPQPDAALGLRRACAATALMLALPGSAYLYQGEELGLPEATRLPNEVRQDPTYEKTQHQDKGRDGCRVPMPWEKDAPALGFGPSALTWLPQPDEYADLAVDQQRGGDGSTLEFYRTLLRLRRELALGAGSLTWTDAPTGVVAFDNACAGGVIQVWANTGSDAVALPEGAQVLMSSVPVVDNALPGDAAAWLHLA